jgi:hypothetical protein
MSDSPSLGWLLVFLGLAIIGVGLVWVFAPAIPWFGSLPGDIRVEGKNYRFYFPLATCLLLSLLLSVALWLFRLLRG